MKKFDVSACSSTNILFTKSGVFEFLQLAFREGFTSTIRSMIGDSYDATKVYRLWGVEITITAGPTTTITEGAVFYNDEFYLTDAATFLGSATFGVVTTQYTTNADPIDFSDGTPRNVCNIRKMAFGAAGGGDPLLANYIVDMPQKLVSNFVANAGDTTLTFQNDNFSIINASSATTLITLDTTRAYVGATHSIRFQAFSGADDFTFATVSGQAIIQVGTFLGITTDPCNILIRYLGVNSSTGDHTFLATLVSQG